MLAKALTRLQERIGLPCPRAPFQPARLRDDWTFILEQHTGGYKARKYLSLIPWLVSQGSPRVRLEGSRRGNNLAELAARLLAVGLEPVLPPSSRARRTDRLGNESLLSLLRLQECEDPSLPAVPEGASCLPSLPGSLTLAASLGQQMLDCGKTPDCIFIDSGTGFTASALLLGLGQLDYPGRVVVVDLAREGTRGIEGWMASMREALPWLRQAPDWTLVLPPTSRSFGSANRAVWQEVERMARGEGIWVDPLYTAKLTLTARVLPVGGSSWLLLGGGKAELLAWQHRIDSYTDKL